MDRTQFTFRIDRWDHDGHTIMDHVAGSEDLLVAMAAYEAACRHWPGPGTLADFETNRAAGVVGALRFKEIQYGTSTHTATICMIQLEPFAQVRSTSNLPAPIVQNQGTG